METGGHNPNRVNHFAEAGAATEQLQSNLRVGNFSKRFENPKSLSGSGLHVAVAVLRNSHRPSQKFEVTVPHDFEVRGKLRNINSGGGTASEN